MYQYNLLHRDIFTTYKQVFFTKKEKREKENDYYNPTSIIGTKIAFKWEWVKSHFWSKVSYLTFSRKLHSGTNVLDDIFPKYNWTMRAYIILHSNYVRQEGKLREHNIYIGQVGISATLLITTSLDIPVHPGYHPVFPLDISVHSICPKAWIFPITLDKLSHQIIFLIMLNRKHMKIPLSCSSSTESTC